MVMSGIIAVIPISAPETRKRFRPFTLRVRRHGRNQFHGVSEFCKEDHAAGCPSKRVVAERLEPDGGGVPGSMLPTTTAMPAENSVAGSGARGTHGRRQTLRIVGRLNHHERFNGCTRQVFHSVLVDHAVMAA